MLVTDNQIALNGMTDDRLTHYVSPFFIFHLLTSFFLPDLIFSSVMRVVTRDVGGSFLSHFYFSIFFCFLISFVYQISFHLRFGRTGGYTGCERFVPSLFYFLFFIFYFSFVLF